LKLAYLARITGAVLLTVVMAACAQASDDAPLPTLAVLPTAEPTATLIPTGTHTPTPEPTEEPPPEPAGELPVIELPAITSPGDGQMRPGCEDWQAWQITRLQLQETIYSEPVAEAPSAADVPLLQVRRWRDAVALLDYDECLADARAQFLTALDEASAALGAPDRATAAAHEQRAAQAYAAFEREIGLLQGGG
jgi:hypothetical protein